MNETQLSSESDEIADSLSFSAVAIVGIVASFVGIFSLGYKNTIPFAVIGTALGAFVLITAKRFRLNLISRTMGFLAVVVGATFGSWGMFARQMATDHDLNQAKQIAQQYLDGLSKGDMDKVLYLVGFQLENQSPPIPGVQPESEADKAKRKLMEDESHVEIRNRRNPAKWVFVNLESKSKTGDQSFYKLRYKDEGQTNPPSYFVFARKDTRLVSLQGIARWFVDNLESTDGK